MGARDFSWFLRGHSLPYLWLDLSTLRCRVGPGEGRVSGLFAKKDTDKWKPSQRGKGLEVMAYQFQQLRKLKLTEITLEGTRSVPPNTWKGVTLEEENLSFVGMKNEIRSWGWRIHRGCVWVQLEKECRSYKEAPLEVERLLLEVPGAHQVNLQIGQEIALDATCSPFHT